MKTSFLVCQPSFLGTLLLEQEKLFIAASDTEIHVYDITTLEKVAVCEMNPAFDGYEVKKVSLLNDTQRIVSVMMNGSSHLPTILMKFSIEFKCGSTLGLKDSWQVRYLGYQNVSDDRLYEKEIYTQTGAKTRINLFCK